MSVTCCLTIYPVSIQLEKPVNSSSVFFNDNRDNRDNGKNGRNAMMSRGDKRVNNLSNNCFTRCRKLCQL